VTTEDRFWGKVLKGLTDTGCWEWVGTTVGGYGQFRLNGKGVVAHRFAWELSNGAIPKGIFCCHKCDNRICVRVGHLFLGTPTDNIRDMIQKGRRGRVTLTPNEVREVRRSYEAGSSTRVLANAYGVDRNTVYRIVTNRTWLSIA